MSAIGSVIMVEGSLISFSKSPTGLTHARYQPGIRIETETNSAQTELAVDRARPTTIVATIFFPCGELWRSTRLGDFGLACHERTCGERSGQQCPIGKRNGNIDYCK